jgi:multiple sugar transport system substrate-binding protein
MKRRDVLGIGLTAGLLASCRSLRLPSTKQSSAAHHDLEIWWSEGYYPEETDAIELVVNEWGKKSGKKAKLSFFSEIEIAAKAMSAASGGPTPDILYGYGSTNTTIPLSSYRGQIAPLGDIINPIGKDFLPGVMESISYYNQKSQSRAIYGAPLSQHSTNIHYWRDLLEEATGQPGAGMVPRDWDGFWKFWGDCQNRLRQKGYNNVYAMALPMSSQARDTYHIFEVFLEAHGVEIINQAGQLQVDQPGVRQGIIDALLDYTNLYKRKTVPPQATRWSDADNNIDFLSSLSLMTINPTLSIPGSQLSDEIAYYERLGSLQWPNGLDGKPIRSIITVNQAIVFNGSNVKEAKSFLSYLLKPENLSLYVQGAQGRFLPVNKKIIDMPYWRNPLDQHLKMSIANLKTQRKASSVLAPAYSAVIAKNVWPEAVESIATATTPVDKAADKAILDIKNIFATWR